MSVVVAPDKFAGSLTAPQVADAVAQGWRSVRPGDRVGCLPMSDGGPGFIDALAASLPGTAVRVGVRDPLGGPVTAECLVVDGSWYVESAQAAGLALVPPARRDPGPSIDRAKCRAGREPGPSVLRSGPSRSGRDRREPAYGS